MLSRFLFFIFMLKGLTAFAFDVEQVKKEITAELLQDLKATSKSDPVLILIGGYPGAGKTTLIKALHQLYDIDVISWNSIRQSLLDRNLKGSPHDWEIIEAVNQNLLRFCLQRNVNIVIDVNAYSNNIKLFESLLDAEQCQNKYHILKFCLNTPSEILLRRVRAREQREDLHQGTEIDLQRDLNSKHKKIYMADYSLIIKNDDTMNFEQELSIVNSFLRPYFDKQQ